MYRFLFYFFFYVLACFMVRGGSELVIVGAFACVSNEQREVRLQV